MRLIDADVFVKNVVKYSYQSTKTIGAALRETPTVDAEPVVRCKDCIWYAGKGRDGFGLCRDNGKYWAEEDFCSYGDKGKEDEHP